MRLSSLLPLLFLALGASAAARDRVFDIVPPASAEVEMVDGYTVLRQAGTKFGVVLTFMPETGTTAWLPVVVMNTSGAPLKVGTRQVSARQGNTALKVWSTSGLVRLAKEGRVSAEIEPKVRGPRNTDPLGPPGQVSAPATIGGSASAGGGQRTASGDGPPMLSNRMMQQQDLARDNVTAMRNRLFRDQTLQPQEVGRGDVRVDLPPRGAAGKPAEFVLTLRFGGESMDVLYRERVR